MSYAKQKGPIVSGAGQDLSQPLDIHIDPGPRVNGPAPPEIRPTKRKPHPTRYPEVRAPKRLHETTKLPHINLQIVNRRSQVFFIHPRHRLVDQPSSIRRRFRHQVPSSSHRRRGKRHVPEESRRQKRAEPASPFHRDVQFRGLFVG